MFNNLLTFATEEDYIQVRQNTRIKTQISLSLIRSYILQYFLLRGNPPSVKSRLNYSVNLTLFSKSYNLHENTFSTVKLPISRENL